MKFWSLTQVLYMKGFREFPIFFFLLKRLNIRTFSRISEDIGSGNYGLSRGVGGPVRQ